MVRPLQQCVKCGAKSANQTKIENMCMLHQQVYICLISPLNSKILPINLHFFWKLYQRTISFPHMPENVRPALRPSQSHLWSDKKNNWKFHPTIWQKIVKKWRKVFFNLLFIFYNGSRHMKIWPQLPDPVTKLKYSNLATD